MDGTPHRDAPCLSLSIGPSPEPRNLGLSSHVATAASKIVSAWVAENHPALLAFWAEGHS